MMSPPRSCDLAAPCVFRLILPPRNLLSLFDFLLCVQAVWCPELLDRQVKDPKQAYQLAQEEEVKKCFSIAFWCIFFLSHGEFYIWQVRAFWFLPRDAVTKIGDAAEEDKKVNIRVSPSPSVQDDSRACRYDSANTAFLTCYCSCLPFSTLQCRIMKAIHLPAKDSGKGENGVKGSCDAYVKVSIPRDTECMCTCTYRIYFQRVPWCMHFQPCNRHCKACC